MLMVVTVINDDDDDDDDDDGDDLMIFVKKMKSVHLVANNTKLNRQHPRALRYRNGSV